MAAYWNHWEVIQNVETCILFKDSDLVHHDWDLGIRITENSPGNFSVYCHGELLASF